jgi:hypothetical protein
MMNASPSPSFKSRACRTLRERNLSAPSNFDSQHVYSPSFRKLLT